MRENIIKFRFIFMLPVIIFLILAIWGGLLRLGINLLTSKFLPYLHGPLMVSGFLGTLISLERAVALHGRNIYWVYLSPLFTILGTTFSLITGPEPIWIFMIILGSLGLLFIYIYLFMSHKTLFNITMGIGALLWFIANIFWFLKFPIYKFVFLYIGFLLLTIAGERLELSRIAHITLKAKNLFSLTLLIFLTGVILYLFNLNSGLRILGFGTLLFSLWLINYDIAKKTLSQKGLTKFMGICLFTGYIWLGLTGISSIIFGELSGGYLYDAMLHSFFLGFVFSMIFAHAPIIFPSVTGLNVPFKNIFYLHFYLLQFSLILRILGDFMKLISIRNLGGSLNALALILFLINTSYSILNAKKQKLNPQ